MRTDLVLILFASCIAVCRSSVSFSRPDPNNPGKCFYNGKELNPGENQFLDSCSIVNCNDDGSWTQMDCGVKSYENCTRGDYVDLSLPYPKCCKWYFECENAEGKYTVTF